ncbi:MAG: hypothetical protein QXS69_01835 [Candidatus Aenigmatarchaeota archaeon]
MKSDMYENLEYKLFEHCNEKFPLVVLPVMSEDYEILKFIGKNSLERILNFFGYKKLSSYSIKNQYGIELENGCDENVNVSRLIFYNTKDCSFLLIDCVYMKEELYLFDENGNIKNYFFEGLHPFYVASISLDRNRETVENFTNGFWLLVELYKNKIEIFINSFQEYEDDEHFYNNGMKTPNNSLKLVPEINLLPYHYNNFFIN